jgi:hypothetical protein
VENNGKKKLQKENSWVSGGSEGTVKEAKVEVI